MAPKNAARKYRLVCSSEEGAPFHYHTALGFTFNRKSSKKHPTLKDDLGEPVVVYDEGQIAVMSEADVAAVREKLSTRFLEPLSGGRWQVQPLAKGSEAPEGWLPVTRFLRIEAVDRRPGDPDDFLVQTAAAPSK